MKILAVEQLAMPEIKLIRFSRFHDHRGYFAEHYRKGDFHANPLTSFLQDVEFVQMNESFSYRGAIRGLHFQWNPYIGKLVRTLQGHMLDLVLDIRKGSPRFGKIIAHDMPSHHENGFDEWIWIPPGFAHGITFLQDTMIEYFCSAEYNPNCEAAISPLAEDLDWSLCDERLRATFLQTASGMPLISDKDKNGFSVTNWGKDSRANNFVYQGVRSSLEGAH
jgi:dTDP-4-dehydrorhamnose 3,5-epimerase